MSSPIGHESAELRDIVKKAPAFGGGGVGVCVSKSLKKSFFFLQTSDSNTAKHHGTG